MSAVLTRFLFALLVALAAPWACTLELDGPLVQGGVVIGKVAPGTRVALDGRALRVSADGRFVIGFDRDAPVKHVLKAGAQTRELITGRISGVYGSQRFYNGEPSRPHYGVDVAAPVGAEVRAPAPGVVTLAEPDLFYSGGTVIIDHGHALSSSFLHLSKVLVEPGQRVEQGELIARVGATGRVTGPHLDWRMNWRDARVDPQLLAGAMPASPQAPVAQGDMN
jgi:murein DD-endopeptidase MepM/ murein hydrolase activator NlpD